MQPQGKRGLSNSTLRQIFATLGNLSLTPADLAEARDDHGRNHAFLMNAAGEWPLAPAYDVSFSEGPGGEHSMAIAGEGRVPGQAAIEAAAKNAGIKPPRRDAIIDEVDAALSNWEQVAQDFDVPNRMIRLIKSEIKAARARKWPLVWPPPNFSGPPPASGGGRLERDPAPCKRCLALCPYGHGLSCPDDLRRHKATEVPSSTQSRRLRFG